MLSTILLILAALAFFAAGIQHAGLIVTIRAHYAEYYERVGKPPAIVLTPLNMGAALSFLAYIILGEFKRDEPPEQVIDALNITRHLFLATFVLLIAAVGVTFL